MNLRAGIHLRPKIEDNIMFIVNFQELFISPPRQFWKMTENFTETQLMSNVQEIYRKISLTFDLRGVLVKFSGHLPELSGR